MGPRSAVGPRLGGTGLARCGVVHRRARRLGGVLVLALDTSTPAVTAGVVELTPDRRASCGPSGSPTTPASTASCCCRGRSRHVREAGIALPDLDAVVVGIGPGPFTGLRVGMVTAAALGDALGIPVHGVARSTRSPRRPTRGGAASSSPPTRVGARCTGRRTPAASGSPGRTSRPPVALPAGSPSWERSRRPAPAPPRRACGWCPRTSPGPGGLVSCAVDALRAGAGTGPLEPLYLRRPDAVAPGPRKPVRTG